MQDQTIRLSLGNRGALQSVLIVCRPAMAAPSGPDARPLVGRRSESWSIAHRRARASDAIRNETDPAL